MTRRLHGQRPTTKDVARWSGVSRSTVSRVINGEPKVRAEVVEATDPPLTTVHQDVGEMGRLMARLLFDRPSDLPSVVVPTRLVLRASA
ncbi:MULTISPECIES: LacI family DNA-binding transcriptional regulator [unclassified Streptomyces]|uniref:LacI family DNA-binding transcriptional regulator n=1 Tax=unclassified Streptomyces TaxID=2593676 RepID=UPI0036E9A32F